MGLVSFVTTRLRENASGAIDGFDDRGPGDRVLAERKRVAQELHDTLLQGFFAVSMRLHTAVNQLSGDSSAKAKLSEILGLMDRTLDEGRRAVEGLRSPHPSGGSLGQALAGVPKDLCQNAQTIFTSARFT